MAVQKSRVTPSRRGMRRSHDALTAKQLATDPTTRRDPPAPPRHRRRLLPRQAGHRHQDPGRRRRVNPALPQRSPQLRCRLRNAASRAARRGRLSRSVRRPAGCVRRCGITAGARLRRHRRRQPGSAAARRGLMSRAACRRADLRPHRRHRQLPAGEGADQRRPRPSWSTPATSGSSRAPASASATSPPRARPPAISRYHAADARAGSRRRRRRRAST